MSFDPNIARMAGLRSRRAAAGGQVHQAQHERESVSAFAEQSARRFEEVLERGLAKVSRPDGQCVPHAGGGGAGRRAGLDSVRQRQRRHSHDRHAGLRRRKGELLRLPYPSYILYRTLAADSGGRGEEVRFKPDWSLPETFAAAARATCSLPSCRTRTARRARWFRGSESAEFAERLPCPLLVDEAYVDFADENCLDLVKRSEKILVSRSLSKSYALAGLRFGFVVAQPHDHRAADQGQGLVQLRRASIAAATAAIDDQAWLAENRAQNRRHARAARRPACGSWASTASRRKSNFVWCTHPARPAKPLYEALKASAGAGAIHELCRLGRRPADQRGHRRADRRAV